jgi:DNA polymerase-1
MLKISVKDKHGKETTGINELKKLRVKSKFLDQYIALKELKKKISSYGSNWLRFINPSSGRIHCSVNQILETGRTATYEPNLYQMPRENEYRNCIMVQKPENFFIGGDYSAQEGKIMADKAKDKEYIEFFHTGDGDAHSFVATKMFSAQFYRHIHVTKKQIKIEVLPNEIYKEVADKFIKLSKLKKANHQVVDNYVVLDLSENNEWRQNGKTLNFFLSFGGSAYTLSNDLKIPMDEAVGLVTAFFDGFPTLKAMFELEKKFALENGYTIINPITKRKRFYREWDEMKLTYKWLEEQKNSLGQGYWVQIKDKSSLISKENSKAYKLKGEIERAAMNTPIQGTAADMTKLAFIKLREKIIAEGLLPLDGCPIMPVLVPHDEIRAEVTPEYLELAKTFISDAMAEAGALFVTTIDLRPEIDVEKYWKK